MFWDNIFVSYQKFILQNFENIQSATPTFLGITVSLKKCGNRHQPHLFTRFIHLDNYFFKKRGLLLLFGEILHKSIAYWSKPSPSMYEGEVGFSHITLETSTLPYVLFPGACSSLWYQNLGEEGKLQLEVVIRKFSLKGRRILWYACVPLPIVPECRKLIALSISRVRRSPPSIFFLPPAERAVDIESSWDCPLRNSLGCTFSNAYTCGMSIWAR